MKKRICGFRQKLGIILAAGMIVSNMNFAVLPVSATEGDPTQEITTSADPAVQAVLDAMSSLPSLDAVKELSLEELTTIGNQVTDISEKIRFLSPEQKELLGDTANTFEEIENYFKSMAESDIQVAEENTALKELSEEDKANLVKAVTDRLAAKIKEVAAGTLQSTQFDVLDIVRTYDNDEAACYELNAKGNELLQSLNLSCQNNLFWFDKSHDKAFDFSFQLQTTTIGTEKTVSAISAVFSFVVSPEYRVSADNLYTLDTTKINSANTALNKAQEIVNANASKSDYEKLLAYKNEICALTSYDHEAAKPNYSGSKAPWTMVSVFDGNPDTKVVCEGYAKAFQYLCDLSTFKSAKCYTVSGTMAGGTGAGGHMWNIVSIGSSNYLVDVTNCDDGAVGSPDKLFMAIPSSGAWNGTYTFSAASNITYTYDPDQIGYYGESILKLATTPYDPTKEPVEDDTNKPDTDKPGTDKPDTPDKPNKPSKPSKPSKPGSSSSGSSSSGSSSSNQTGNNTSTQTTTWAAETNSSDQNTYRLEVRSAIEVSAELAGNDTLNTPEKIESQIRNSLTAKGISNDNIRVYDVALQVYVNGAWQNVSAENFPAEGVTVTVPYPAGTDSTYNFVASHLFTKSMNGYSAGHIETFPESGTIKTSPAGISFTVHGLSPISVGWSKTAVNSNASANVSPKTGDHTTILLYMVLMIFAAAVMGTVYVKQIRIRRK